MLDQEQEQANSCVKSYRQRITQAAEIILNAQAYPDMLMASISDLSALYSELTMLDVNSPRAEDDLETILCDGKAISPRDAARCLLDLARTTQFIRGIHSAITDLIERFPGQRINVLYAGCGPYATLVMPLFSQFSASQLSITLIDIHQRSLHAARRLVEQLAYSPFINDYIQTDASRYRHPAGQVVHLVISETMQKALAKEPQLAMSANLASQITDGGIMIPQQITIELCLGDARKEFAMQSAESKQESVLEPQRDRIMIGRVMELTMQNASEIYHLHHHQDNKSNPSDTAVRFSLPETPAGSYYQAMLLTHITVYGQHKLDDYDSGLTMPTVLHGAGIVKGGELIEFEYSLGKVPGFKYRFCATYAI